MLPNVKLRQSVCIASAPGNISFFGLDYGDIAEERNMSYDNVRMKTGASRQAPAKSERRGRKNRSLVSGLGRFFQRVLKVSHGSLK